MWILLETLKGIDMEERGKYEKMWDESPLGNMGCSTPLYTLILIGFVLLLASCATRTQIEYVDREVVKYVTKEVHDTLIDKTTDSVYVNVYTKGDTVFSEKYKEKTRWRDRIVMKIDTCYRDSVVTEYKETVKEVVKFPKSYWYSVGISILFLIFAAYKILRWLKIIH